MRQDFVSRLCQQMLIAVHNNRKKPFSWSIKRGNRTDLVIHVEHKLTYQRK